MKRKNNRLEDAENVMEACAAALALIPITQLRKGAQWMPSDYALDVLAEAKDAMEAYARRHDLNGGFRVR